MKQNSKTTIKNNNTKNTKIFVQGEVKKYNSIEEMRKDAKERARLRRKNRLIKAGLTEKEISEIENNSAYRNILCISNGTCRVENGTREVQRRDKKTKQKVTVEVPNILRGVNAMLHILNENNIKVICNGTTYVYVSTTKDNMDSVIKIMEPMGKLYITRYQPAKVKVKNDKKPTNNTSKAKKDAKKKKASSKRASVNMRPYYAALRKGKVHARIKKYNKSLADKIEKWLNEQKNSKSQNKEHRAKHRQLTSIEMKANKRARKVAKRLITLERKKEAEKNNRIKNEKNKITKSASKQQELKIAA